MFPVDGVDVEDIYNAYETLSKYLLLIGCGADVANYLNKNLNTVYDCLTIPEKAEQLMKSFR